MDEYEHQITENVLARIKGKVKRPDNKLEEADCILTERHMVIETEQPVIIPLSRIHDSEFGLPDPPATSMYMTDAHKRFDREAGETTGSELQSLWTVTYSDDLRQKRKISLATTYAEAGRISSALGAAIGKIRAEMWPSLPLEVRCAGFWRRFVAYIIDIIILGIISYILILISAEVYYDWLRWPLYVLYFIGFWKWRGQTPGKMVMGVKIVTMDEKPISLGRAVLRYIGYIISDAILFIGHFMIAFDGKKQGLHDKIAGTIVLKRRP